LKRALQTPRGQARLEFAYRGLDLRYGSPEESFAMLAYNREQQVRFYSVLSVINAILGTGNLIVQALTGQPGDNKSGKALQETMSALRELLLPDDTFEAEKKIERIKAVLEREVAKGPISIRPQAQKKKRRGIKKRTE
jgi:hypothetical protein